MITSAVNFGQLQPRFFFFFFPFLYPRLDAQLCKLIPKVNTNAIINNLLIFFMIISSFNIVSCDYTDVTLSFKDKYFKLTTKLKKTVLIAPLNWGLGHATRCIPIINALLQAKVEVIIASDGTAMELLKKEFPELTHLELPAYNVTYRTSNMVWNIGTQVFKIVGR